MQKDVFFFLIQNQKTVFDKLVSEIWQLLHIKQ